MCNRKAIFMKSISLALVLAGVFLFAFIFPEGAHAQFTTVTATVTDPNGIPYGNGTMSAVLVPGAPGGFRLSGQPYSGQVGPFTLDSTGKFTANFGDVTLITPSAQWQITVNSNQGGIAPPLGTGGQTFVFTSSGTTISGSSPVDISASLNALAPKLTNITVGSGTVTSVSGTSPIVATPNPIIGTGSISCPTCTTGSGASPRIAFWSSSSALSSDSVFLYNTSTKQFQFNPATQSASSNPFTVTLSGNSDGGGGSGRAGQFVTAPTSTTTTSNVPTGLAGIANTSGAGNFTTGVIAVVGSITHGGSGTLANAYEFNASTPGNAGGGTITNAYGFYANDIANIAGTLNVAFNAALQTAGANNWGFFSASGNQDHFGSLFSGTDNVTAGSLTIANGAANAHTIFSSAATTTNTIAGFASVPVTGHVVTCTVAATTCTLTDGGAPSTGTVTNIATTSPITGGPITTTGTIACATCVTSAAALTSNQLMTGAGGQGSQTLGSLGTTTTLLHGNAAGAPSFTSVVSADLNITASTCTNQFLTAISSTGVGTCTTATLASAQFANQGTTTTVLHGNGAGNPSFAVVTPSDATGNTSGSGNFCLVTSCTMVTPALGTPSALVLTNATGLPFSSIASATNTAAAMVIGTGASLTTSGTGTIATTTQFTNSAAGAASASAETLTGTLFTGGTGTTTFPHFYINQGAGPTTFSTNGTTFGINAPSGFTGNFLDFRLNGGASAFLVNSGGTLIPSSIRTNTYMMTSTAQLWESGTAPTIAGAGCGGSAASITANNGTAAFKINVGTAPGSACTVTLPSAATGWNCSASDITTQTTNVSMQRQTGAESTTSVTITNFSDLTVATAFVANDVLKVTCAAD
jgi:hypothetical protein